MSYEFADRSCALIFSYVNFTPRGFTLIPEFLTFNLLSRSLYFKKFLEVKLSVDARQKKNAGTLFSGFENPQTKEGYQIAKIKSREIFEIK